MASRMSLKVAIAVLFGVTLGWLLAGTSARPLLAGSGDRSGESIVTTGPVFVRFDEATKSAIPLEAVYLLDYKEGRLMAAIPSLKQTVNGTQMIEGFEDRDLVADFKLDLDSGPRPRFLMTTGATGPGSTGNAVVYVFEATTKQLAVYRLGVMSRFSPTTLTSRPKFELVEVVSYAKGPRTAQH